MTLCADATPAHADSQEASFPPPADNQSATSRISIITLRLPLDWNSHGVRGNTCTLTRLAMVVVLSCSARSSAESQVHSPALMTGARSPAIRFPFCSVYHERSLIGHLPCVSPSSNGDPPLGKLLSTATLHGLPTSPHRAPTASRMPYDIKVLSVVVDSHGDIPETSRVGQGIPQRPGTTGSQGKRHVMSARFKGRWS